MKGIGVALSGGGHRASLFGLGVLLYLADAGKLPEVTSIASVSGGSLTNGYVAQTLDVNQAADGGEFEQAMKPFARQLAQNGSLFASRFTWGYLAFLALTGLVALVGPWFIPGAGIIQFLIFLAVVLLWAGLVAGRRSWIAARAFRETLFSPRGHPTLLRDIEGVTDHIFCTTDLQSAENVYFSRSFVYGYRFGVGVPGDLPLHDAVQASACLPGAFPARWFRTDRHTFKSRTPPDEASSPDGRGSEAPSRMVLTDGGVYDNMADEWALNFVGRARSWPALTDGHYQPQELIVVNASAGLGWVPLKRSLIPGIGELLTLLKVKDVLYDQTTATRRRMMDILARWAARTGEGMRVALVSIGRSPFFLSKAFARHDDAAGARARAVLAALGDTEMQWEEDARRNAQEKTSLSKLGTDTAARLLHHAYVLAMANLHVTLDYRLLKVPDRERFLRLVA
ncbi:MAG TPA: patatin-like phospholipase family protein [Actinomycetota bacterium]